VLRVFCGEPFLKYSGHQRRLVNFPAAVLFQRMTSKPLVAFAFASLSFLAPFTRAADAAPAAAPPSTALVVIPWEQVLGPIRLWQGDAPGALGQRPQDIPTLTPFLPPPEKRNGASMLILPGGGYSHLAEHEGDGYATWFAEHGVAAYVLKYRLGASGYRHPIELGDAARALRLIRTFAKRDGLDASRVGVIGSSAGGHLAATLATHFDAGKPDSSDPVERERSRPEVAILCYPVITMGEFTHNGSKRELLGQNPAPELIQNLSAELRVTAETPPTFLWHTFEDKTVPVENSLMFAAALRKAKIPFSLHIYEQGAHGLGLGRPGRPAPPWGDDLLYWLKERKFIP
jgi:acetyl esterase/lipase